MSRPSVNFIAKSFIPTSVYSFALQVRDYRILFALNSASTSNLPYVPVYTPRQLSRQLDTVVRLSLEQQLLVNDAGVDAAAGGGTVTITLPQTCQWYAKDFLHLPPAYYGVASVATLASPTASSAGAVDDGVGGSGQKRSPSSSEVLSTLLPFLRYVGPVVCSRRHRRRL